tara:strand:+ start:245 stop:604 length:360 start_codon:yes stop_codon:yes gene_type:complete
MKSTELRTGNLVSGLLPSDRDMYPCNFKVTAKMIYEYSIADGDFIITGPVTLTEEWLVEFGFEVRKTIMSAAYEKNGFIIYLSTTKNPNKFELGLDEDVVIEYVHTLQNLYYALKQEEL